MDIVNIDKWGIGAASPLYIAGPCSVETPDQLEATVKDLAERGFKIIRGGVWKPRTRPNSFEGVGEIALPWIEEVKQRHHVRFAIEVASPYHVEKALKHGIDLLWVGARTTVNPFAVQEIADSLQGVDIPVLVKNPVNPDLALWIGALERINQAGVQKLGGIHRGFSNFNDQVYRNSPAWQIPLELKTRYPNLPILNDPSHICGRRDLLASVAQMAMDLNFDGLIIESHNDPDQAWSDAAQQITPLVLEKLIKGLQIRKVSTENPIFQSQLELIREQIDQVDNELLEILSRRMKLVEKAGEYKKLNNVAIFQMERWKKVFETRPEWGRSLHLNQEFVKELYKMVHTESIRKQEEIMEKPLEKKEK
ncbi:MAG: 3-deoxy-7-phosphoheptulonate synthase [Mongoliibacter sp.]|uniref:bifunctional 3-deoxy-7-phosphoheptulonate synthase/chorismate mutase type II n=1 Tax=Mongoliibacter sp. TaxID=2022438 RepID=UPI0012F3F257|nr:bifunctional 3-deoxy-7-phosphoheptulonate synthase/chorismate mutase type II [Mongoliibacter sp.]TVP51161.1 MAG: 3-deoxy-7-phosphoheptulonate synthase [Mongoliibacter sp.]